MRVESGLAVAVLAKCSIPAQIALNMVPVEQGSHAPISVKESTTGIVRVVEDFIGKNEQQFVDFQGQEIAW